MIFLALFVILLYFLCKGGNKDIKGFVIVTTVIMAVMAGLRHEGVGSDTYGTMMSYERFAGTSWSEVFQRVVLMYLHPDSEVGKDPGEIIFFKLLSYINTSGRFMIMVVACITMLFVGNFFYKNSRTMEEALFGFLFYITMFYQYLPNSSVRQSLSVAIVLFAYRYLEKKKVFKYIVIVLLASLFHKSAILALSFCPIYYFSNVKLIYKLSFPVFVLALVFYREIALFLSFGSDIYSAYGQSQFYSGNAKPFMVIIMIGIMHFIGIIGLSRDTNVENNRLMYICSIMTFVLVPMIWADPSLLRIIAYSGPWMGIMVSRCLKLQFTNNANVILALIILVFLYRLAVTTDQFAFMWQNMYVDN